MSTKKKLIGKPLAPILEKSVGPLTFGMFLRATREMLDLTQVELAKKLDMAKGTLCDIEKGRQLVSPELAVKIARKLGVSEKVAVKASLQDQVSKLKMGLKVELVAA